jgi:hypothetical protein
MANFVYGKAKQALLNGGFNFSSNNFKVALVKSSYTPSQNVHEFLSDISNANIAYVTENIPSLVNNLGVVNSQDFVFTLPENTAFNAAVIYQVGSSQSNSRLLSYTDTASGFPFTGSQNSVTVAFDWIGSILTL